MIKRTLPLPLLLVAAAVAQAPDAPAKHLLRYQFQPDAVSHFSVAESIKMTASMGGQEMTNEATMTRYLTAKVMAVTEGAARIEQRVMRIAAKARGQQDIDLDSADSDADLEQLGVPPGLLGAKVGIQLTERGKVSDFDVPEALRGDANDESVGKDLASEFVVLPEQPIAIGESWKSQLELPIGPLGKFDAEVENTLLAVSDRFIELRQEITFDVSTGEQAMVPLQAAKAKAKVKIDRHTGLQTEMEMDTTVEFGGGGMKEFKISHRIRPTEAQKLPAKADAKPDAKDGTADGGEE